MLESLIEANIDLLKAKKGSLYYLYETFKPYKNNMDLEFQNRYFKLKYELVKYLFNYD